MSGLFNAAFMRRGPYGVRGPDPIRNSGMLEGFAGREDAGATLMTDAACLRVRRTAAFLWLKKGSPDCRSNGPRAV